MASPPYLILTAFDGTDLDTASISMTAYHDSGDQTIPRIVILSNGTKYDVDGTADGDMMLGRVMATFKVRGATAGMEVLNATVEALEALGNKHGTLTGIERTLTSPVTHTCTARCVLAQQQPYAVRQNVPMLGRYRGQAFVDMVFERLTEWS